MVVEVDVSRSTSRSSRITYFFKSMIGVDGVRYISRCTLFVVRSKRHMINGRRGGCIAKFANYVRDGVT